MGGGGSRPTLYCGGGAESSGTSGQHPAFKQQCGVLEEVAGLEAISGGPNTNMTDMPRTTYVPGSDPPSKQLCRRASCAPGTQTREGAIEVKPARGGEASPFVGL